MIHLRVAQAYFDFGYYKNSIKICANINKLVKDDYEYWLEFADDDSEQFCFYAKIYVQTLMQWSNALLKFDDDLNCLEGAAERIETAIQVYLQLAKYDASEMKKEYERRVKELNEIIVKYKSRKAEENDG